MGECGLRRRGEEGADAVCAGRIILETDPVAIASRVSRPKPDAGVNLADITINEQTIMAVRSFLSSRCETWGAASDEAASDEGYGGTRADALLQAFSTVRDKMAQRILNA